MLSDLNLHSYDVQNSFYIQPTLALEGVKYALNIHYDEDYCLYLRIHLIDTSFITKDSYWYKEMEREIQKKDKRVKKLLSFKEGRKYPAFTIQFKINSNGEVAEPHFYKSSIQIDRVVRNREFLTYREDDALKPLVGALRQVANDYTEEIKSTLNQENTFVGEEKQKQLMKAKEKKEKESQK